MTYYDPLDMTEENREKFLDWIRSEELDPNEIVNDRTFRVHNGRISGFKFVRDADGKIVINRRKREFLKVPFNAPQHNSIPEGI